MDMEYFFHAGETMSSANENLLDVVMLQTQRIGHGFGLFIIPKLIPTIREKAIAIECCPFSNQVLGYVKDVRNHPARMFMNMGVPVTISPDDPALFDYSGMTLDFVMVTLAWQLDLGEIKALCLNSLKFSALTKDEKLKEIARFEEQWSLWVNEMEVPLEAV